MSASKKKYRYSTATPSILYELDLTSFDRDLFGLIRRYACDEGCCLLTLRQLSEITGTSKELIIRSRNNLEGAGLIRVEKNGRGLAIFMIWVWDENEEFFDRFGGFRRIPDVKNRPKTVTELFDRMHTDRSIYRPKRHPVSVDISTSRQADRSIYLPVDGSPSYSSIKKQLAGRSTPSASPQASPPTTNSANGFSSNSGEFKLDENTSAANKSKKQIYAEKLADKLCRIVTEDRNLQRKYIRAVWTRDLLAWIDGTGKKPEEINEVIKWFEATDRKAAYMPLVCSAKSFADKFPSIRRRMIDERREMEEKRKEEVEEMGYDRQELLEQLLATATS